MWLDRLTGRGSRRPSRLHTANGRLVLTGVRDLGDGALACTTAILRKTLGYRVARPWISGNAFREMRAHLPSSAKVFEWGSGMSTVWFDRHCLEVHSVEDNIDWFNYIRTRVHSTQLYLLKCPAYAEKILDFPDSYFDLISIDGSDRDQCLECAVPKVRPGGMVVLDNTDSRAPDMLRAFEILKAITGCDVKEFSGWAPGNAFPQETTILTRRA